MTGAFVNTFLLLVDVKNADVLTSLNALGGMTPIPFLGSGRKLNRLLFTTSLDLSGSELKRKHHILTLPPQVSPGTRC